MYQKIIIAQNIKELRFISSTVKGNFFCLPLNLKTQLYCENNHLPFVDLIDYTDKKFHQKIQSESQKIFKKINCSFINSESLKKEFNAQIRHKIYNIIFLYYIIKKINKKKNIKKIYVSGWNFYNSVDQEKNYFLSDMISTICKNFEVINIDKNKSKKIDNIIIENYKTKINNLNEKIIVLNNLGYNFKRIILWTIFKKFKILIPTYKKVNFFQKFIRRFFNIYFLEITRVKSIRKNFLKSLQKVSFKKIDITKCVYFHQDKIYSYFLSEENKVQSIESIFKKLNLSLVISNIARGIDGSLLELASKLKINSLCISHGTISSYYNKYDKIYKESISEAVFSDSSRFNALQSKISKNFAKAFKKKNYIRTGNLIFNEKFNSNGKHILYAVTMKDFHNFHPIGVETFYEYLDNLNILNDLAKDFEYDIIVKPHPSEFDAIPYLKKKYKNLKFTNMKNRKLFSQIKVAINFSSTMIEDSLYSNIPVILLDRWKRYKHCDAETNISKKNSAIYYINDIKKLKKCLRTIFESNSIKFSKYTFDGKTNKNFDNILTKLAN